LPFKKPNTSKTADRVLCYLLTERQFSMGSSVNPQELRDLLVLAKKLRASAAQTADHAYIELFLKTATALEERAHSLAFGVPPPAAPTHFDLLC